MTQETFTTSSGVDAREGWDALVTIQRAVLHAYTLGLSEKDIQEEVSIAKDRWDEQNSCNS